MRRHGRQVPVADVQGNTQQGLQTPQHSNGREVVDSSTARPSNNASTVAIKAEDEDCTCLHPGKHVIFRVATTVVPASVVRVHY